MVPVIIREEKENIMGQLQKKKKLNLTDVHTYSTKRECEVCSVCILMWPASQVILVALVAMAA